MLQKPSFSQNLNLADVKRVHKKKIPKLLEKYRPVESY